MNLDNSKAIHVIIQARMNSSRLPTKVLTKLNGITMLERVINRLKQSYLVTKIIVATTDTVADDPVVELCSNKNWPVFRGSENDVLDRYYQTAKHFGSEVIIRCTSDCPLVDAQILDQMIDFYLSHDYDYIQNSLHTTGYPSGFDCAIYSMAILTKYWQMETNPNRREHATGSLIYYPNDFNIYLYPNTQIRNYYQLNFDYHHLHLSVDTKADYEVLEKIISYFENDKKISYPHFSDIIKYLNQVPTLIQKNTLKKEDKTQLVKNYLSDYQLTYKYQDINVPTLILVSNEPYLVYLESLIKSIQEKGNLSTLQIYLYLVNVDPEHALIQKIKLLEMNESLKIVFDFDYQPLDPEKKYKLTSVVYSQEGAYCANIRIPKIRQMLSAGFKTILYFDVDSLVRGDLNELIHLVQKSDITAFLDRVNGRLDIKTGILGFCQSERTLKFLSEFADLMTWEKLSNWRSDQDLFNLCYQKNKNWMTISPLPFKYIDWTFDEKSVIWAGKGVRKHRTTFQQEMEKFIEN